jgi:hypothetical protein
MKYHYDIEQGTDEWLQLRLGKITGSTAKQLLTPTHKIAKNDKVRSIIYQLASERITNRIERTATSYHMERGNIEEVFARDLYSEKYSTVKECGFIENGFLGYSPDGLVGENGLIEIKSRMPKYQVQTIIDGKMPSEYMIQCQIGLMATERKWIDFVQYSNGMELFVERITRDDHLCSLLDEAIKETEEKINQMVEAYKQESWKYHKAEYIEQIDPEQEIEASHD